MAARNRTRASSNGGSLSASAHRRHVWKAKYVRPALICGVLPARNWHHPLTCAYKCIYSCAPEKPSLRRQLLRRRHLMQSAACSPSAVERRRYYFQRRAACRRRLICGDGACRVASPPSRNSDAARELLVYACREASALWHPAPGA